jgi:gamma-glutamyltranspeptidase/glutathione hydrolase
VGTAVVEDLLRRGHDAKVQEELGNFGRGQIIWKLPSGALIAGSEPRADGQASGF